MPGNLGARAGKAKRQGRWGEGLRQTTKNGGTREEERCRRFLYVGPQGGGGGPFANYRDQVIPMSGPELQGGGEKPVTVADASGRRRDASDSVVTTCGRRPRHGRRA